MHYHRWQVRACPLAVFGRIGLPLRRIRMLGLGHEERQLEIDGRSLTATERPQRVRVARRVARQRAGRGRRPRASASACSDRRQQKTGTLPQEEGARVCNIGLFISLAEPPPKLSPRHVPCAMCHVP